MFQSMVEPYTGVKRCLWKRILHQITFASRSASSLLQVISFFWQAKTQFLQDYFNQQQFQSVDITICVFLINIIIYIYICYIYIYMLHTHAYIYIYMFRPHFWWAKHRHILFNKPTSLRWPWLERISLQSPR